MIARLAHLNVRQGFWGKCFSGCFYVAFCLLILSNTSVSAQEGITVSGITEPIHDVTLSATVSGRVAKIFYQEGEKIEKGATILELDKKLEKLEVDRRKMIWESKAELNSAKSQVRTLAALLDSTKELFESTGSVSKEELARQVLEYEVAVSEKQRLETAEEREHIEYEMALEQYHKRSLKAPFSGIITELYLDEGETLEADEPLAHMVDISRCLFVCNIEERVGRKLEIGQTVELEIRAGAESLLKKGKIVFVCPVVDPASGLLRVKVVFDNKTGDIYPGVAGVMHVENVGIAVVD